jgi:hypothetical protein
MVRERHLELSLFLSCMCFVFTPTPLYSLSVISKLAEAGELVNIFIGAREVNRKCRSLSFPIAECINPATVSFDQALRDI